MVEGWEVFTIFTGIQNLSITNERENGEEGGRGKN
jgi:hypothetical protein